MGPSPSSGCRRPRLARPGSPPEAIVNRHRGSAIDSGSPPPARTSWPTCSSSSPWYLMLGAWSVLGPESVLRPSSSVLHAAEGGPRTKDLDRRQRVLDALLGARVAFVGEVAHRRRLVAAVRHFDDVQHHR